MAIFRLAPIAGTEAHPLWERNLPEDIKPKIIFAYSEEKAREFVSSQLDTNPEYKKVKEIRFPYQEAPVVSDRAWLHPELVNCDQIVPKSEEVVQRHRQWEKDNPDRNNYEPEFV